VPAPPHAFALDERRLAYGRFEAAGGGHELRELRRVELPPDSFAPGALGGAPRDAAAFAERLGQLLAGLSAPVTQASLVLPDAWLRVTFVEIGDLPRTHEAREEVLRWKLKRLVPFRVDDLRLNWCEVAPLPQQAEPRRLLVAFGLEVVLAALEAAFAARGVWLGRITSESLALLPAVDPALTAAGLAVVAVPHAGGYTLLFTRLGEPVFHRFKGFEGGADAGSGSVARDLRLTRAFVAEQLPEAPLERVVLASPPARAAQWAVWLEEGFGREAEPLESLQLPLSATDRLAWAEVAPMLGAVRQEVT
jgi:type IV pilus assembly protein PilM